MINGHGNESALDIAQKLDESIRQLHKDLRRVEVWAGALSGFAQPVPEYRPASDFLLPQAATDETREVASSPQERTQFAAAE